MRELLGDRIQDAYEETFTLFSETLPSNNLGFVDSKAGNLEIEIGGHAITLKQSPGLLVSQRKAGTTGAVLWKITPLIAEWLVSMPVVLRETTVFNSQSRIVELGCGVTGLLGISLAPLVATYVLTDQAYVRKNVQDNIDVNMASMASKRKPGKRMFNTGGLRFSELDWEMDTPSKQTFSLAQSDHIDLVIACDCVYNEHLIKPLVETMVGICRLGEASDKQTAVLIAQQLRSEAIFEEFVGVLLTYFELWRIPDGQLPPTLRTGSGYAVHIGWLEPHHLRPTVATNT